MYKFPRILILITLVLLSAIVASASRTQKLRHALVSLDNSLENYDLFRLERQHRIDSMASAAYRSGKSSAMLELGKAYAGFNNDSAANVLRQAIRLAHIEGDSALKRTATIEYASILPKSGIFTDAINLLDQMHSDSLTDSQKMKYYGVKSQIMINAATYAPFKPHERYYDSLSVVLIDSLKYFLRPNSLADRLAEAQKLMIKGDDTLAFGELSEALENTEPSDPSYAVLTGMLAKYFRDKPDRADEYIYYLTLSAKADVSQANGEAESLLRLGNELFSRGDVDHAFTYISASGKFMAESGSRTLITEIAPPIAVYSQIIRKRDNRRNIIIICVIALFILGYAAAFWYVRRSRTKFKALKEQYLKLTSSVNSRDQYINELLNLCAVYVESMEDYNRFISRKLKANQVQDLLKTVESGKVMQDQTEKFFTVFDHAVFKIYPDFLNDINSLLIPDKRLSPGPSGRLLPELRIAAFMRLGVTDSNRLSKFLGLSLNTIYTYRNRLKSRALNRDTFERDVIEMDKEN
ncbi:MAG: hypothetical protein K2M19_02405 [Muribaculaceae bacterium]|nr:hypothetical protein [Muribaculaceae bacterium]